MTSLRLITSFLLLLFTSAWAQAPGTNDGLKYEFDEAYGLYMNKQKMGYELFTRSFNKNTQTLDEQTIDVIRMNVGGGLTEDIDEETVRYSLKDGLIESFSERKVSGKSEDVITGQRKGDKLLVEQNGVFRVVPQPKANLNQERRFLNWLKTARKGDTFEHFETDWERDPIDVPGVMTFLGRRPVLVSGVKTEIAEVRGVSDGMALLLDLNEDGIPLRAHDEAGFIELRRESKENAKKLEETTFDLFTETGVALKGKLGEAFVEKLELKASDTFGYQFPEASYQKSRTLSSDRHLLKLVSRAVPDPEELKDRQRYLKSTPTLQTGSSLVRETLRELALSGNDRQKVKILNSWVYDNLGKTYTENATTATAVLQNMAGDCTEHTLLLTTLLRAEGIPAREVTGLIYAGDELGKFVHHAWVEVYVDGGWLASDPAFDQFPADATHILLARENDLSGVSGTAKLKLEVYRKTGDSGAFFWLGILFGLLAIVVVATVVYGVRLQER